MSLPEQSTSGLTKAWQLLQKRSVQIVCAGGILLGTGALAISNPSKTDYVKHTTDRLMRPLETSEKNCDEFEENIEFLQGAFKLPTKDLCRAGFGGVNFAVRPVVYKTIELTTERPQNLGICSIYTTGITGEKMRTLAIGGLFIQLP